MGPWLTLNGTGRHGNRMYLAGGTADYAKITEHYYRGVWSTEDGVQWEQETEEAPWMGSHGLTITSFDDKIWMIGGSTGKDTGARKYSGDLWMSADGRDWCPVKRAESWATHAEYLSWMFD